MENISGFIEKFGIDQLSVEQRIALIEAIWASIDGQEVDVERLTDAQRAEYEMRVWDCELDEDDIEYLWEIDEALAISRGRH